MLCLIWILANKAITLTENILGPFNEGDQICTSTQLLSIASKPTPPWSMAADAGDNAAHPTSFSGQEPSQQPYPTIEHSLWPHLTREPEKWTTLEASLLIPPAVQPCLIAEHSLQPYPHRHSRQWLHPVSKHSLNNQWIKEEIKMDIKNEKNEKNENGSRTYQTF